MTGRIVAVAIALSAALCWTAAALGGLTAARWMAAGCVAVATLVARALTRPQERPRTPRYGIGRAVVRHPFPRYHQLVSTLGWATRDRRYHDRVLTPLLDQIAADVDDPALVEAVRADAAAALDQAERRQRRWT